MEKIYIASDHAGFEIKEHVKNILNELNLKFEDLGPKTNKAVDYPDYAKKVAKMIQKEPKSKGILICGSGTGMQISANKFNGIRAAFAYDSYSAKMSREDNDANILTLRARNFPINKYKNIIKIFFNTNFSNEKRHINRINKISNQELEK